MSKGIRMRRNLGRAAWTRSLALYELRLSNYLVRYLHEGEVFMFNLELPPESISSPPLA